MSKSDMLTTNVSNLTLFSQVVLMVQALRTVRYQVALSPLLFFFLFSLFLSSSTAKTNDIIIDNGDLLYVIIPKEVTSEFSPTEKNYFKERWKLIGTDIFFCQAREISRYQVIPHSR